MRARLPAAVLLALATAACGESRTPTGTAEGTNAGPNEGLSAGSVRIVALNTTQSRGGAVLLDLVNDSTITAGTNGCAEGLERRVGDGWSRLPQYDIGCFALWVKVDPNGRGRVVAPLPMTLEPGTYRSVHALSFGPERIVYTRHSTPFEVR